MYKYEPRNWLKGLVDWTENNKAYVSVVFSWLRQEAFQRCVWYKQLGYDVKIGGPAASDDFYEVAEYGQYEDAIWHHNPNATFTSRGCIRNCKFCIVPRIEGDLVELNEWPIRPIICDNNLLATSRKHFDDVIDKLKPLTHIDFNQGLDARLLTEYHAERLRELRTECIRLAWDHSRLEKLFMGAVQKLLDVGFHPNHIQAYVLIGYNDTPEDALYRLQTIKDMGMWPNPMRYQPLDAIKKNGYIHSSWTERELLHYMRYWSRQVWLKNIPFEEYECGGFRLG